MSLDALCQASILKSKVICLVVESATETKLKGGQMYNPNNYELPDSDDPRLTDYVHSYDCLFTHAVAFSSEEYDKTPYIEIEFSTPFGYNVPFHYIMWPDTPFIIENKEEFDLEQLNPDHSGFSEVKSQIVRLLKIYSESGWTPPLEDWYEYAKDAGKDKVGIVEYRVRYIWRVRAWDGLTLEHLESVWESTDEPIEFSKSFVELDNFILLDSNEIAHQNERPDQLVLESEFNEREFEDPSKDGLSVFYFATDVTKRNLWSRIQSLFRR